MRAAFLAAAALVPAATAAAQPGDVPYFAERHTERRAMLEWCARDAARQDSRECRNARAAGAVELMTPGNPWGRLPKWQPPRPVPTPQPTQPTAKPNRHAT